MPIESEQDLEAALAYMPKASPELRSKLEANILKYRHRVGGREGQAPQEGLQDIMGRLVGGGATGIEPGLMPEVEEANVVEIGRPKPGVAPGAMPSGDGGSGGAMSMEPEGDGGTGMTGNMPQLNLEPQLNIDIEATERAQLAPKVPKEWVPPRQLGLLDRLPTDFGGKTVYYIEPSLETFKADLAQRARGLKQHALAAQEALQTQAGAMAPEAMLELQTIVQSYQKAVRDATEAGAVNHNSPSFQEWRSQKWAEYLAQHQQNPDAGPIIRTEHAPTDSLWEKIGYGYQKSKEAVTASLASALESATVGISTGPVDAILGPEQARVVREVRNESTIADTVGAMLGFPFGLGGRLISGLGKVTAPLGKTLGGALAGGEATAIEGTVSDLSHDYLGGEGEQRFNNPNGVSESEKLAARMGIGGLFGGIAGFAHGRAQKGIENQNLEGLLDPSRGNRVIAEKAGFRPKLTGGIKTPQEVKMVLQEAQARGATPEDVLAGRAAPSMVDANARRMSETGGALARVRAEYGATPEGQNFKVSQEPMIKALDEEIARATQTTGQPMVGSNRTALERERWKLFDPEPVAVVPEHEALVRAHSPEYTGKNIRFLRKDVYEDVFEAPLEIPEGHVVFVRPGQTTALKLEDQINKLQNTLKPGSAALPEGEKVVAFRSVDQAAREMRDKFPWPKAWSDAGRMPPVETIELGDGTKMTIKGWSALIRKAASERSAAEGTRDLVGIQSDLPFSRQKAAGHIEPFMDKLKASPTASEAEKNAFKSLAEAPEAQRALELMAGIYENRKLAPGSSVPIAGIGLSGPRAVGNVGPGRIANSWRSMLLQLAEEDPGAPGAILSWLRRSKPQVASKIPPPEAFGLAPLRVGQGRLGASVGAGYNAQQGREQRTAITPDILLKELTEEDLQTLARVLEAYSKKGQEQ